MDVSGPTKIREAKLGSIVRPRAIDNDLAIKIDFRRRSRDRDSLADCGVVRRDAGTPLLKIVI